MSNDNTIDHQYDPYATLNVARHATLDDIRAAYKRACITFHPDKHPTHKKHDAETVFARIQTSYAILSDPKQRLIYDELGWKGIQAAWQIGPHLTGVEEVVNKLEADRRRLFSRPMACKTTIQAQIDGTGVETVLQSDLDPEGEWLWLDFCPTVHGVSVGQRFEQVFDNGVVASCGLDVLARGGMGAGSVMFSAQKPLDQHSKASIGCSLGTERHLSMSVSRMIWKGTGVGLSFNGRLFGGQIVPTFQFSFNKLTLNDKLMMTAAMTTSASDHEQTGLVLSGSVVSDRMPTTVTAMVKPDGRIGFDVKHQYTIDDLYSLKLKLSTIRQRLSMAMVKKWTVEGDVKLTCAVEFSGDLGTVLKVSLSRYDYHFVLPIIISPDISSMSIALATALPMAVGSAIRSAYKWYDKRKQSQYWERYRRERQGHIMKLREDAMLAQWLMTEQYEMVKASSKLVILSAIYRQTTDPQNSVDITIPLQLLVVHDGLTVAACANSNLVGSFDVAIGAEKETVIEYRFGGHAHHAVIPDHQPIILPQRSHIKS